MMTSPYRIAAEGPPPIEMWYYGVYPPIGTPLYFIFSGANGGGDNRIVGLYNNWRSYVDEWMPETEIQALLSAQAQAMFPRGMLEVHERFYAPEDRASSIMGLTERRFGVRGIPYVRVGTYQGVGRLSRTGLCRYVLVRPDSHHIDLTMQPDIV